MATAAGEDPPMHTARRAPMQEGTCLLGARDLELGDVIELAWARWLKAHGRISGSLFFFPEKLGSCVCVCVFSPTCGPAFGRSAHVRKPRAAHQPPRFHPAPPLPAPLSAAPHPPPRTPAAQIDVSPA
jgi:hypothetical protein